LQLILILKETIENTAALIEIVRIYSHRDSPPSDEIVESLTEMGFEETAVLAALKKTGNNKASACEWLCDNRSGSVIELREGLAPDSPILKVILEMPQVQMTLSNPKTFLGRSSFSKKKSFKNKTNYVYSFSISGHTGERACDTRVAWR